MLTPYQQKVLQQELISSDYNGMTVDQAWIWLMSPIVTSTQQLTNISLTPVLVSKVLGPLKANALAANVRTMLPEISDSLMQGGVNLSDQVTIQFLPSLVGGLITLNDINVLLALGVQTVTITSSRRFESRFDPIRWPHITSDGQIGSDSDPALSGFPNDLIRSDFDITWITAGRT